MKNVLVPLIGLLLLTACSEHKTDERIDLIEQQIYGNPDSTLQMLAEIDPAELDEENLALWAMFYSWTQYRNYAKVINEDTLMMAFDYFHNSKDPLRKAQVYYLRSVINEDQQRGDPAEWVEDLYRGCKAIEQTTDYVLGAQLCQRYGAKLYKMHQYEESIIWEKKYVEYSVLSHRQKDEVLANINLSLSQLYAEDQRVTSLIGTTDGDEVAKNTQFDEAFATLYHALDLAKRYGLRTEEGKIYGNLAIFHSRCQRIDSLLHYALKAKEVDEEQFAAGKRKDPVRYLHISDAYRKLGDADSAIYYALIDTHNPSITTRRNAAQQLYMVYRDLKGDYKSSLEWMSRFNAMNDSIHQRIESQQINTVKASVDNKIETEIVTSKSRHYMIWGITGTVCIILAFSGWLTYNRRRYKRQLKKMEDEFNLLLQKKKATSAGVSGAGVSGFRGSVAEISNNRDFDGSNDRSFEGSSNRNIEISSNRGSEVSGAGASSEAPLPPAANDTPLHLTGSTKEQLEIQPEKIIFLTSESNYIKIYYQNDEGKLQHKLLRQTISNCEEMLQGYSQLVRCHRAFIVNLQHVTHASSVPNGLQLSVDATSMTVPVSRTYISVIRDRLRE